MNSPKYFVAPMVEQSELAWRLLSRKYGAQITYTPMYHAKLFATQEKYRKEFTFHEDDHPLVVQFCANDPEYFVQACKLVEDQCIAVDLNLGCPQGIAKRGHYGSFLQDEWDLIAAIVKKAHEELSVPIFCKIRIFDTIEKSVAYAKMLVDAGCQLLTVHGRLREQKGQMTGIADWDHIKAIKEAIDIPVIANGNILYFENIEQCIAYTGVDGVMSAEGNLYNPGIFQEKMFAVWKLAQEYLDICDNYPDSADHGQAKAHVFKIFHRCLQVHTDLRDKLAVVKNFEMIKDVVTEMKKRLVQEFGDQEYYSGELVMVDSIYQLPIWVAQPYIRPPHVPEQKSEKRSAPAKEKPKKHAKLLCRDCPNVRPMKHELCKACQKKAIPQGVLENEATESLLQSPKTDKSSDVAHLPI